MCRSQVHGCDVSSPPRPRLQWQQVLRGLANVEAAYDVHTARAMKQNVLYMFDKGFESAFNSTGELRSQFMLFWCHVMLACT